MAYGSAPEQVVGLLLAIAHDDPEVLDEPEPSALLEELGDSALKFVLYAFVPEPGLIGSVKHRLAAEVQRRFGEASIGIPYPTQEVYPCRLPVGPPGAIEPPHTADGPVVSRFDLGSVVPPAPHVADSATCADNLIAGARRNEELGRAMDQ